MNVCINPIYTTLTLISAYFGLVQGIIWAILSFIGIVWHLTAYFDNTIKLYEDSYETVLNSYLFEIFIKSRSNVEGLFVQPNLFFGLMFIYFIFHITWAISSAYLYSIFTRKYEKIHLIKIYIFWIIITGAIAILDLILFSLLVHDYKFSIDYYDDSSTEYRLPYLFAIMSYEIMMTIIARGYILWFLNCILIGIAIKIFINMLHNKSTALTIQQSIYRTTRSWSKVANIPEEAINAQADNIIPVRRQNEPNVPQTDRNFYRIAGNSLSAHDAQIENRLQKYTMTPNRNYNFGRN